MVGQDGLVLIVLDLDSVLHRVTRDQDLTRTPRFGHCLKPKPSVVIEAFKYQYEVQ